MAQKRCFGCMKRKQNAPVCEHCGYNETTDNEPHQLPCGTVLRGQYLVGKVLGQGGFGITYLGWDRMLEIPVAIKEYYPNGLVTRDAGQSAAVTETGGPHGELFRSSRERFLREAKALAKFSSVPEIVRVFSFFEENNTAYIIMEYVEGTDLRSYVSARGGSLTAEETFRLLRPVMEALSIVHEAGLVHRDISPDNIMILPRGSAKLLDFGAVRDVGNAGVEKVLTHSTQAILKHGFAPVEQYQSRGSLGPWTDVYALCGTIYYCLTGQVPVDAPLRVADDVDLGWEQIPGLTAEQTAALEKGMEIRPKDRIRSVRELCSLLFPPQQAQPQPEPKDSDKIVTEESAPQSGKTEIAAAEKPPRKTIKKTKKPLAAAAALILAAAAGLTALGLAGKNAPAAQVDPDPQEETTVQTTAPETVSPSTSWEDNVLMEDSGLWTGAGLDPEEMTTYPVFGSDILRNEIGSVTILDTLAEAPEDSWDVSKDQNGSVLAWAVKNGELYDLYLAGEGGINAKHACKALFFGYCNMTRIDFGGCFHTENTTTMSAMFSYCKRLQELDVSSFDTANVTDMAQMFNYCESLTALDLTDFNTEAVTNMVAMFQGCSGLESLNVSSFDTSGVSSMAAMFNSCRSLTELDLSGFDTSRVKEMELMFQGVKGIKVLDLSSFNTSMVTNMTCMFYGCDFASLNISSFHFSRVTSYDGFMDEGDTVNGRPWIELFEGESAAEPAPQNISITGTRDDEGFIRVDNTGVSGDTLCVLGYKVSDNAEISDISCYVNEKDKTIVTYTWKDELVNAQTRAPWWQETDYTQQEIRERVASFIRTNQEQNVVVNGTEKTVSNGMTGVPDGTRYLLLITLNENLELVRYTVVKLGYPA